MQFFLICLKLELNICHGLISNSFVIHLRIIHLKMIKKNFCFSWVSRNSLHVIAWLNLPWTKHLPWPYTKLFCNSAQNNSPQDDKKNLFLWSDWPHRNIVAEGGYWITTCQSVRLPARPPACLEFLICLELNICHGLISKILVSNFYILTCNHCSTTHYDVTQWTKKCESNVI